MHAFILYVYSVLLLVGTSTGVLVAYSGIQALEEQFVVWLEVSFGKKGLKYVILVMAVQGHQCN